MEQSTIVKFLENTIPSLLVASLILYTAFGLFVFYVISKFWRKL